MRRFLLIALFFVYTSICVCGATNDVKNTDEETPIGVYLINIIKESGLQLKPSNVSVGNWHNRLLLCLYKRPVIQAFTIKIPKTPGAMGIRPYAERERFFQGAPRRISFGPNDGKDEKLDHVYKSKGVFKSIDFFTLRMPFCKNKLLPIRIDIHTFHGSREQALEAQKRTVDIIIEQHENIVKNIERIAPFLFVN